jgi:hypothetical protein
VRCGLPVPGTGRAAPSPGGAGASGGRERALPTRPDQQRRRVSPAWLVTQAERKPPSAGRAVGRRLLVPSLQAMSSSRIRSPPLSEVSSPGGAAEAAALVLATQEFVTNGGGRASRRRWSAASPGRTGSLGRVGQRGLVAFQLANLAASSPDFRVLGWMRWSRPAGDTAHPRPRRQREHRPAGRSQSRAEQPRPLDSGWWPASGRSRKSEADARTPARGVEGLRRSCRRW